MTVFVRRDTCYVCDQQVFWNDETELLTCGCGQFPARFVNLREFVASKDNGKQVIEDSKEVAIK